MQQRAEVCVEPGYPHACCIERAAGSREFHRLLGLLPEGLDDMNPADRGVDHTGDHGIAFLRGLGGYRQQAAAAMGDQADQRDK